MFKLSNMLVLPEYQLSYISTLAVAIENARIIFAITQYDLRYVSSGSEEMDEAGVRTYLQEILKDEHYHVEDKHIVTVSSDWALKARQLRMALPGTKQSLRLLRMAQTHLMVYRTTMSQEEEKEKGEEEEEDGEDVEDEVMNKNQMQVADQLEEASNIREIEKE